MPESESENDGEAMDIFVDDEDKNGDEVEVKIYLMKIAMVDSFLKKTKVTKIFSVT